MRKCFLFLAVVMMAGCASQDMAFYSPYDLDRDGVIDVRCPGMEYEVTANTWYGWRSEGSAECEKQSPGS